LTKSDGYKNKERIVFNSLSKENTEESSAGGKNTKRKISGEWSVSMFEEDRKYTSNTDNSFSRELLKFDGEALQKMEEDPNQSSVFDGIVHEAYWNIKKDGTWERKVSYTVNEPYDKHKFTRVETGSWMFYAGVGEYKKHERIVFTTATISEMKEFENNDVQTINYKIELSETYETVTSKNKTLELALLGDNSYSEINYSNAAPTGEEIENGTLITSRKYRLTK